MAGTTIVFLFSLVVLWFSAGLIFKGLMRLSHRLKLSAFATSFFILGMLTSVPEFSIGINAVLRNNPEIFVGNIIGASLSLFVLVIPILAIFGNGIKLSHEMSQRNIIFALFVIATPLIFTIDHTITRMEGLVMLFLYALLFYFVEKKKGLFEKVGDALLDGKRDGIADIGKIVLGTVLVFLSSMILVDRTTYLAEFLGVSSFLISVLILGVGTNLPELFIGVTSILKKQKQVAFGDFIGSASANAFFFGLLALTFGPFNLVVNHFLTTSVFFFGGLMLFFAFAKSGRRVTRLEGVLLLVVYVLFVMFEVLV